MINNNTLLHIFNIIIHTNSTIIIPISNVHLDHLLINYYSYNHACMAMQQKKNIHNNECSISDVHRLPFFFPYAHTDHVLYRHIRILLFIFIYSIEFLAKSNYYHHRYNAASLSMVYYADYCFGFYHFSRHTLLSLLLLPLEQR